MSDHENLFAEFLTALDAADVRVLFWVCPVKWHGEGTLRPTVQWRDGVAHCTYVDCDNTSATGKEKR